MEDRQNIIDPNTNRTMAVTEGITNTRVVLNEIVSQVDSLWFSQPQGNLTVDIERNEMND